MAQLTAEGRRASSPVRCIKIRPVRPSGVAIAAAVLRSTMMIERTRLVEQVRVPSFLYGTAWKEEQTKKLTRRALDAGFRGIDTANQRKHYVEAAVGEAISEWIGEGHGTREDLFIQTKFTSVDGQDHRLPYERQASSAKQVAQSLASSLDHFRSDYVDSFVLHGPSLSDQMSEEDWAVWEAMCSLHAAGKTRLVGVSNVSAAHIEALCAGGSMKPAFVQNRCYARTGWDFQVRQLCRRHGVVYQGFSLLTANRGALTKPAVLAPATRTKRTPAQIVFRFALEVGMIALTGTSDAHHMQEDLAVFDFALSEEEVSAIERVGTSGPL